MMVENGACVWGGGRGAVCVVEGGIRVRGRLLLGGWAGLRVLVRVLLVSWCPVLHSAACVCTAHSAHSARKGRPRQSIAPSLHGTPLMQTPPHADGGPPPSSLSTPHAGPAHWRGGQLHGRDGCTGRVPECLRSWAGRRRPHPHPLLHHHLHTCQVHTSGPAFHCHGCDGGDWRLRKTSCCCCRWCCVTCPTRRSTFLPGRAARQHRRAQWRDRNEADSCEWD